MARRDRTSFFLTFAATAVAALAGFGGEVHAQT